MLKRNPVLFSASALIFTGLSSCQTAITTDANADCSASEQLPMSRLQYVGSHNSYHIAPPQEAFEWLSLAHPNKAARHKQSLGYTHQSLEIQLDSGHRMLELDVHPDSNGGRFTAAKLREITGAEQADRILSYNEDQLLIPGLKTVHYPNFDLNSHCPIFLDCLSQIKNWHDKNPKHLPLIILIEVKEGKMFEMHDSSSGPGPLMFEDREWIELQSSILETLGGNVLIFPSDVWGEGRQIEWPSIENSRGKIAFLLFDYGNNVSQRYAKFLERAKKVPILHIQKDAKTLPASWTRQSVPDIRATLKALDRGMLVYSKADTTGIMDKERKKEALASGANLIATDYPDEFTRKARIRRQCK